MDWLALSIGVVIGGLLVAFADGIALVIGVVGIAIIEAPVELCRRVWCGRPCG